MKRADVLLVASGLVHSRTLAQKLIQDGHVEVCELGHWRLVSKSAEKVNVDAQFRVTEHDEQRFVSRAGLKLDAALEQIGLDVKGLKAIDVGQSTGGFTDCLLQRGCASVTGIEVGHSQLVDRLRNDKRIQCIEGLNARELGPDHVNGMFELAVMDVSFISQTLILPRLPALMSPGACLISLVKPQFEVGPEGIGKGGLVKNVDLYQKVEQNITTLITKLGFERKAYFESAILGGDGNREFFLFAQLKC